MLEHTTVATGSLTYQPLGENIHFIRFEASSRQTVTTLMTLLERLYTQAAEDGALYLLVDSVSGTLPMTTTVREGIELEKRHPHHPKVYVALMHQHPLAKLLDTMLRPLRINNQIRLFEAHEREQAINWLLAKQEEAAMTDQPAWTIR